jgi:hypothetical protein
MKVKHLLAAALISGLSCAAQAMAVDHQMMSVGHHNMRIERHDHRYERQCRPARGYSRYTWDFVTCRPCSRGEYNYDGQGSCERRQHREHRR